MNYLRDLLEDPRTLKLSSALSPHGELYIVGGAIRDALLKNLSKDIDFSYSKDPNEIKKLLETANIKTIPTGLRHQTVSAIVFTELPQVEITSFRNENMKPEGGIFLGKTISEDLHCRDFTINSIALRINFGNASETKNQDYSEILIDPLNGVEDIRNSLIRTSGDPDKRFSEDPLRILRMVRFSATLNFEIETSTLNSAIKNFALIESVSIERIRDEFFKILTSNHPRKGFLLLKELSFFKIFIPEIDKCINFEQNKFHKEDVFIHTIDVIEKTPKDLLTRLSALFHDVGKPPSLSIDDSGERHFYMHEKIGKDMIKPIAERMRFSNELTSALEKLVFTHMRPLDAGSSGLRRLIRDTEPYYDEWRALKYADSVAVMGETEKVMNEFKDFDERIFEIKNSEKENPFRTLAINGEDLIKVGFKPGVIFKDILNFLQEKVIEKPELNNPDTLKSLVLKHYKEHC